jgi:hypothetical protein
VKKVKLATKTYKCTHPHIISLSDQYKETLKIMKFILENKPITSKE